MPNHVTNRIKLCGNQSQINAMLEAIKSDEYGIGTIDFNKITPMPDSLNIEAGSKTDRGLKAYEDFIKVYTLGGTINMDNLKNISLDKEEAFLKMRSDINLDDFSLGKKAWQNIQDYGSPTWYDWASRNDTWNTKWNAYGYDKDTDYSQNNELWFQTAWAAPHPILDKLSEMYPDITIEHKWADEDIGANCGSRTYLGGERTEEYSPETDAAATEFACQVWDCEPMDMDLCLNSTGTEYINLQNDEYELIELLGKPALFTNERMNADEIPRGLYRYDLRESDSGAGFAAIEPSVTVNHGGTVITDEPINFGEAGYISFTEDTTPNFIGSSITLAQYMTGEFEQEEGMTLE